MKYTTIQKAALPVALAMSLLTPAAYAQVGNPNVFGTLTSTNFTMPNTDVTAQEHPELTFRDAFIPPPATQTELGSFLRRSPPSPPPPRPRHEVRSFPAT
jgi:hypothetical protein